MRELSEPPSLEDSYPLPTLAPSPESSLQIVVRSVEPYHELLDTIH
jgi:hypothetical protein